MISDADDPVMRAGLCLLFCRRREEPDHVGGPGWPEGAAPEAKLCFSDEVSAPGRDKRPVAYYNITIKNGNYPERREANVTMTPADGQRRRSPLTGGKQNDWIKDDHGKWTR